MAHITRDEPIQIATAVGDKSNTARLLMINSFKEL